MPGGPHHLNVAKEIAQKLQMNYVFGREFQELTQGFARITRLSRPSDALALAVIEFIGSCDFQKQSNFWRPHWFLPEIEPFQGKGSEDA